MFVREDINFRYNFAMVSCRTFPICRNISGRVLDVVYTDLLKCILQ